MVAYYEKPGTLNFKVTGYSVEINNKISYFAGHQLKQLIHL